MRCKAYSLRKHFVCLCPSVLLLFKDAFGAFSVEKGEKYHIMECYLVRKPANRLPFRRQEKNRNAGCFNVRCAHSHPYCFNVTFCP